MKTAFLYGNLEVTVYVEQADGFKTDDRVCLLKRSLYGLKQAPRQWNVRFTEFLKTLNLTVSEADNCIFYSHNPLIILTIYVDDGIIFADNLETIDKVIDELKASSEIHEVKLDSYLGFEIIKTEDGLFIHQSGYIQKILQRFNMSESNPIISPISKDNVTEAKESILLEDNKKYQEMIGCLMYAATQTRPNITFAVNMASRSVCSPTEGDMRLVKRIFRYLNTIDYGILYKKDDTAKMHVFCDADYAKDGTSKSTTGIAVFMTGGLIHWRSQIVTLSSTEAEFVSICRSTQDTIWLRKIGLELEILDPNPTLILNDNQSAIKLVKSQKAQQRTRHMSVKTAYPREQIENKNINPAHIEGTDNTADMFTKATNIKEYIFNRNKVVVLKSAILLTLSLYIMLVSASIPVLERTDPIIWTSLKGKVVLEKVSRMTIHWGQVNPCKSIDSPKRRCISNDLKLLSLAPILSYGSYPLLSIDNLDTL